MMIHTYIHSFYILIMTTHNFISIINLIFLDCLILETLLLTVYQFRKGLIYLPILETNPNSKRIIVAFLSASFITYPSDPRNNPSNLTWAKFFLIYRRTYTWVHESMVHTTGTLVLLFLLDVEKTLNIIHSLDHETE